MSQNQSSPHLSRRQFLQVGAMAGGGLGLANLLRAEDQAGVGKSNRAVINIHLFGGPSHQDTFDMKPNAPVEFRGEFCSIATNVAEMRICEHLPRLAQMADRFSVIRSIVGATNDHDNYRVQTGYGQQSLKNVGGRPALAAVVSKLQGATNAPAWVSGNKYAQGHFEPTGFLGPVHGPYAPPDQRLFYSMGYSEPVHPQGAGSLRLTDGVSRRRMDRRLNLLHEMDRLPRRVDTLGQMAAMDAHLRQAYDVILSGKVADALDVSKEDPRVVERYGKRNSILLKARRLVQAGVRVITTEIGYGSWDTHADNFSRLRGLMPLFDQGMSAFLWDLKRHDMLDDVSIVAWGEFGRTPRINKDGGRDHWPAVSTAFLAGGGMRTGQFIGATDRHAAQVTERPVHFQEVFATLYHNLGIDASTVTITDPNGRPQFLLDHRTPIRELI